MSDSLVVALSKLEKQKRDQIIDSIPPHLFQSLVYHWPFFARPNQLAPSDPWSNWLFCAGRGSGKTRTAAEWIRNRVDERKAHRIALVGRSAADVRDTMIQGDSGLESVFPPDKKPIYEPSKRRITFYTGAFAIAFSADTPDQLRGPQFDTAWCDELAAWDSAQEAWYNLSLALRLGEDPKCIITTTPRPRKILRDIVETPGTILTTGSTYDNAANLAPSFIDQMRKRYEGTSIGRQEIYAELLDEIPGALWTRKMIDQNRKEIPKNFKQIVVGVDPAISDGGVTGIVVCGIDFNDHYYVLDDASVPGALTKGASIVSEKFNQWSANLVVAEKNQGGDLVLETLRMTNSNLPVQMVQASRGKRTRAEPVLAKYEQGRAHHISVFYDLEDQMVSYTIESTESPDRMDAMVWAMTKLMEIETTNSGSVIASTAGKNPWR